MPKKVKRENRRRHMIGFLLAGGTAFLVDAAVLWFGTGLIGLRPEVARIPSFAAAATLTWILNRSFTFQTSQAASWREFAQYMSAMLIGLTVNYVVFVMVILFSATAQSFPPLALVPATLAGMVINFFAARRILTHKKSSTAAAVD